MQQVCDTCSPKPPWFPDLVVILLMLLAFCAGYYMDKFFPFIQ